MCHRCCHLLCDISTRIVVHWFIWFRAKESDWFRKITLHSHSIFKVSFNTLFYSNFTIDSTDSSRSWEIRSELSFRSVFGLLMCFTVLITLPKLLRFKNFSLFWWIAFVTLYFSIGDLSSKDSEYRRVRLRGQFDHSEEIHVLPRSLNEGERSGGGLGRRPKSGAHIITPFEIADSRWVNKTLI